MPVFHNINDLIIHYYVPTFCQINNRTFPRVQDGAFLSSWITKKHWEKKKIFTSRGGFLYTKSESVTIFVFVDECLGPGEVLNFLFIGSKLLSRKFLCQKTDPLSCA